jgi:hypothetical protein
MSIVSVWNNMKEPRQQPGAKALGMWNEWKAVQNDRNNRSEQTEQQ